MDGAGIAPEGNSPPRGERRDCGPPTRSTAMQNRTTLAGLLTTCLAAAVAAPAVAQQAEPQQTEVPPTAGQPNAAQLYAAQPRVAEQTLDATAKVTAVEIGRASCR